MNRHFDGCVYYQVAVVKNLPTLTKLALISFFLFTTRFSVPEMKRIYRGFKTECPTGLITEEAFHSIYARFFPNGGIFRLSPFKNI